MEFLGTNCLNNSEIELKVTKEDPSVDKYGGAPVYYFDVLNVDKDKIGVAELRVGHNDELYYYGNIYVKIDPRYEGFKYGYKVSKLLLKLAKKHEMGYVSITCATSDLKCKSTCEQLGMKLLEDSQLPEDHPIRKIGIENASIYVLDL